jgi:hypothetical protein
VNPVVVLFGIDTAMASYWKHNGLTDFTDLFFKADVAQRQ